ncbi:MAG TPA: hypothetical protein VI409_01055 [Gaiellaceae bacterium]|nr:hypothetical protein [Gaiellaceae bacterium]
MESCLACDLASGRVGLPGGRIHETTHWLVEHCVGPLGVGTLVVKPKRHVVHVWELTSGEAAELGPLLQKASAAVAELTEPEQIYVCLWSHGPGHIHFVIQPVTPLQMAELDAFGPRLQVAMFDRNELPPSDAVEAVAVQLRARLGGG